MTQTQFIWRKLGGRHYILCSRTVPFTVVSIVHPVLTERVVARTRGEVCAQHESERGVHEGVHSQESQVLSRANHVFMYSIQTSHVLESQQSICLLQCTAHTSSITTLLTRASGRTYQG
jgi:hypothetical protein